MYLQGFIAYLCIQLTCLNTIIIYSLDCTIDPLPAMPGGTRNWNNMYNYGNDVSYVCSDGVTMSHAFCKGEVWSYTDTATNCYDGVPPVPQCQIDIFNPSGTISSIDPQYEGCKVTIAVTDSTITLITNKFMVIEHYLYAL